MCVGCMRRAKPGELIWRYFYEQFTAGPGYWLDEEGGYLRPGEWRVLRPREARKAADEVASGYGADRTYGIWG